ncbi:hypothetical protein H8356DRAFT_942269, partial [Neocallimastix lanati (nom. inval.)]
ISKSDITLPENDRLNSKNFEFWYRKIRNMLQARGLMKFIESDYLVNAKKNNSLSSNDLEKATKEQALADSIIENNFIISNIINTKSRGVIIISMKYSG